ncbi:UNKNOWN [Stylonychia lemnae]|uniref:PUM-HD domain-containing protein n=1 Tax=Stylonychia lemnae TaxID=5949 RepID=A0A078AWF0_STYLE|nr:UNKNOWN [Stylonychia lemnae]|eukprot:CDW85572.1 UNKNOWN [Stylonychia lemnae]
MNQLSYEKGINYEPPSMALKQEINHFMFGNETFRIPQTLDNPQIPQIYFALIYDRYNHEKISRTFSQSKYQHQLYGLGSQDFNQKNQIHGQYNNRFEPKTSSSQAFKSYQFPLKQDEIAPSSGTPFDSFMSNSISNSINHGALKMNDQENIPSYLKSSVPTKRIFTSSQIQNTDNELIDYQPNLSYRHQEMFSNKRIIPIHQNQDLPRQLKQPDTYQQLNGMNGKSEFAIHKAFQICFIQFSIKSTLIYLKLNIKGILSDMSLIIEGSIDISDYDIAIEIRFKVNKILHNDLANSQLDMSQVQTTSLVAQDFSIIIKQTPLEIKTLQIFDEHIHQKEYLLEDKILNQANTITLEDPNLEINNSFRQHSVINTYQRLNGFKSYLPNKMLESSSTLDEYSYKQAKSNSIQPLKIHGQDQNYRISGVHFNSINPSDIESKSLFSGPYCITEGESQDIISSKRSTYNTNGDFIPRKKIQQQHQSEVYQIENCSKQNQLNGSRSNNSGSNKGGSINIIHKGQVVQKVVTKNGSKEYQKLIEKAGPEIIQAIVDEIEPNFSDLLIDHYGNYFCQKLFLNLDIDQKLRLLKTLKQIHINQEEMREKISKKRLKTKFLFVSQDSKGTHAIQSFLEVLTEPVYQEIISDLLEKDIMKYAYNKNSNHVLIKYIKLTPVKPYLEQIYDILAQNFDQLAQDANGLPIVKYWNQDDCELFTQEFLPQLQQLSVQKFSSNVIEKALDKAKQYVVELYAQEICKGDAIRVLLRVNFGYYVIERILMNCFNEYLNQKVRTIIQKNLVHMGMNHLKKKWMDMIEKSEKGVLHLYKEKSNLIKQKEQEDEEYQDYYGGQDYFEQSYDKNYSNRKIQSKQKVTNRGQRGHAAAAGHYY